MNAENFTLLEYLAQRLGYVYLSDLHFTVQAKALRREIEAIAPGSFPAAQWREAYQYLVGCAPPGATEGALRQGLLEHCGKSGDRSFRRARE